MALLWLPARIRLLLACTLLQLLLLAQLTESCCPNSCSGHGVCTSMGNGCICSCFKGFSGGDCSSRTCPTGPAWNDIAVATDRAHLPATCSNRGLCDSATGKCSCDAGFTGRACNRLACPGDCSQHGDCRSMKFNALRKDKGTGTIFRYDTNWDNEMVYGCVCDDFYSGGDCSKRTCPTGDDPLTGASTDPIFGFQKNEKQTVYCAATGGTFTLTYRGQTTVPISATDRADVVRTKLNTLSTLRNVNVLFPGTATSMCTADGNFVTMEFTQNFGSLPLLVGESSKLIHASSGITPKLIVTKGEDGSKENEQCSNRGRCDQTSGVCSCYSGYTTSGGNGLPGDRGDCGAPELTIISCPGEIACSGHGYCSGAPQFRCFCVNGWTSGDCSIRTCPRGVAWFDLPIADNRAHSLATCSGIGVCDTSKGECACPAPFEGAACERMACPGLDAPCSGNGRCLTMAELALEAHSNGEPLAITYGKLPNNPKTWDFDKIQGCVCDAGYEGHDCSLRSCPRGDDPRTTGQMREVQTIMCRHTQVTDFTLSFRGERTSLLRSDILALDLQNALSAVKTIGIVRVTYSAGPASPACTIAGSNKISVEFVQALGDVPPLRVDLGTNAALVPEFTIDCDGVGTSKRGTVENIECSNNGVCNYATGKCMCFEGMISSNGLSAVGLREDCGRVQPVEDPLAKNLLIQA